jgi:transcriptional regulator GlxA family with amidase domain
MERHIGDNVSLDDIARAACVSRSHFTRLFRVSMGASPMYHLLRMRIERAKTLLAQNDQSICSIALSLGFFDQSHFSRTFRRMTGMSPSEFARMS